MNLSMGARGVLRTSFADATCPGCSDTAGVIAVELRGVSGRAVRVTAPEPWHVSMSATCAARPRCGVFGSTGSVYLVSTTREDGPVNVVFEDVASDATCPTM
jgi:hypothetical protein